MLVGEGGTNSGKKKNKERKKRKKKPRHSRSSERSQAEITVGGVYNFKRKGPL